MFNTKNISFIVVIIVLISSILCNNSLIVLAEDLDIIVRVDGQHLNFDQPPVIINGRTMVPLRAIFERLGAIVNWEAPTNTITANKEETSIILKVGDTIAYVNSEVKTLDSPPVIIGERTLVPVRFISETLGGEVRWDSIVRIVDITTSETLAKYAPKTAANATIPSVPPSSVEIQHSVELICKEDTFIRGGEHAGNNFSSNSSLELKETGDVGYLRRIYMKFDLSPIPVSNIIRAKIKLYNIDMESSSKETTVYAYTPDNEEWDTSTITYNNAPEKAELIGQGKVNAIGKWHEIDITEHVRTKIAGGSKAISIMLLGDKAENLRLDFNSTESSNKPILLIEY